MGFRCKKFQIRPITTKKYAYAAHTCFQTLTSVAPFVKQFMASNQCALGRKRSVLRTGLKYGKISYLSSAWHETRKDTDKMFAITFQQFCNFASKNVCFFLVQDSSLCLFLAKRCEMTRKFVQEGASAVANGGIEVVHIDI